MYCIFCHGELAERSVYCVHCGSKVAGAQECEDYAYEAFISYRHVSRDREVARKIQRFIEGFRIPKQVRMPDGRQRLGKCFRDEDELPIDDSLPSMIVSALEQSRFLIVVCSPDMRESAWCQREVEAFASLHGRSRILMALAAGEPSDSFPTLMLSWANPEKGGQIESAEPLGADLRDLSRKNFRAEASRLAAAIIGCKYDDLRQRLRSRRMKAISIASAAIATVSVLFSGFSFYQRAQINANYMESLRNQSEYLASEASEFFESGDRMQAVQIALAALPYENAKRPYVPAARFALEQALEIYPSGFPSWRAAFSNYEPYEIDGRPVLSDDASEYAVASGLRRIAVYDAATGREASRCELPVAGVYLKVVQFQNGTVLCLRDSDAVLVDAKTGESRIVDHGGSDVLAACLSSDGKRLALLTGDRIDESPSISIVDTSDFSSVKEISLSSEELSSMESNLTLLDSQISFSGNDRILATYGNCMLSVDVEGGDAKVFSLPEGEDWTFNSFEEEAGVVFASYANAFSYSESEEDAGFICLNADDIQERWRYQLKADTYSSVSDLVLFPEPGIAGFAQLEGKGYAVGTLTTKAYSFDIETGDLVNVSDAGKPIEGSNILRDKKDYLALQLSDGQVYLAAFRLDPDLRLGYFAIDVGDDSLYSQLELFDDDAICVSQSREDTTKVQVFLYQGEDALPEYKELPIEGKEALQNAVSSDAVSNDRYVVVRCAPAEDEDDDGKALKVLNRTDFSIVCEIAPSDVKASYISDYAISPVDDVLYVESGDAVYSIDLETGELLGSADNLIFSSSDQLVVSVDGICAIRQEYDYGESGFAAGYRYSIDILDPRTLEVKSSAPIQEDESISYYAGGFCLEGCFVAEARFKDEETCRYVVYDLDTGKCIESDLDDFCTCESFGGSYVCPVSLLKGARGAVLETESGLTCVDGKGNVLWEREIDLSSPYYAICNDAGTVLLQERDSLFLIDGKTGLVLKCVSSKGMPPIRSGFFASDGSFVAVAADAMKYPQLFVIAMDADSFGVESGVAYGFALSSDEKCVLCREDDAVFTVPRWALEDLYSYADDLTEGHELSDQQRALYLID